MNLKIAICDDMEFYVQNTKKAILAAQRQEDTYEIHEFMSGKALVDYIRKEQGTFDVIFLDIDMPEMSGIEAAKIIRKENEKIMIIFLTNYDEYIREGYQVQAFRFLSKGSKKQLSEALQGMRKVFENRKKVMLQDNNGNNYILSLDEIIYGETHGRNLKIYTNRGEIVTGLTLQKFQDIVGYYSFFRCHRAFVINMEHILSYSNREICMDNGKKVFLSRQRSNEFKNIYIKWHFESDGDYSDEF